MAETSSSVRSLAHYRGLKASNIARVIRKMGGTSGAVEALMPADRALAARCAGYEKPPSDDTWALVIEILRNEENDG